MLSKSTEITTFVKTWLIVYACLVYTYVIGKIVPPGKVRALLISPVITLFLLLPLRLTTVILCAATALLFAWLATFKLALFSFGKGPLAADNPTITFSRFLAIGSLPIILSSKSKVNERRAKTDDDQVKGRILILKALVFALLYKMYSFEAQLHPTVLFYIYGTQIYLSMEFLGNAVRSVAGAVLDLELDPLFDEPLFSSSMQNFWGRRWNLAMGSILRVSIYDPVRELLSNRLGRKHAQRLGVLAAFATSAVMHELTFYYMCRKRLTWQLTFFFLLHGATVVIETDVKRCVGKKWSLPRVVSIVLTMTFMAATGLWLVSPQIQHCNGHVREAEEFAASVALPRSIRIG